MRERQLPNGEFTTLLVADDSLSHAFLDSSPFHTTFVLYALSHVDRGLAQDIVSKAVSFLRSEMEFGGVWRYWSTQQYKHDRLGPDLDDTACVSYALKTAGGFKPRNDWAFLSSRDSVGRFRTWISTTPRNRLNPWFRFARFVGSYQARRRMRHIPTPENEDPRWIVLYIEPDDVDPVVNANVLLYLGERPETLPALDFVIRTVLEDSYASLYYEDPLVFYYAVARAYRNSCPRLAGVGEHIVARIAERARRPEELNPMQAAMALSALLTYAPASPLTTGLLDVIMGAQRDDGGWDPEFFYCRLWGGAEITTAFCLEVLARSSNRNEG
ncbi:MAG TPA: hypothetical protein VN224_00555 [Xanthomonadales bacterium]|nr:hypothetical protein [Xanthomonadales bacterium]